MSTLYDVIDKYLLMEKKNLAYRMQQKARVASQLVNRIVIYINQ